MLDLHYRWATVIGAIPRILEYRERLGPMSYYERLRFQNLVLGPDWAFRLHDLVGVETIEANRPSWLAFYRDDIYNLHLPLDARAPETDRYLGTDMGAMEFAFYAGMGFEGYALALRTQRKVDVRDGCVHFDRFLLSGTDRELLLELERMPLTAEHYYTHYAVALKSLFAAYEQIAKSPEEASADQVDGVAAASLLFLCGGHNGCTQHVDPEEGQAVRLETITICRYIAALASGKLKLRTAQTMRRAA